MGDAAYEDAQLELKTLKFGDATHYPTPGDLVHVQFIGKLLDGRVFDQSEPGRPFEFVLGRGQVIAGWDEGVALMSTGQVAELTIPPRLAYGHVGYPPVVNANTTLVYEIELITFGEMPDAG
jgi:FKBP-type peptidyl-prolyl cis-trans isomerase